MQKEFKSIFQKHCPKVSFGSLRWVQKESEIITVRDETLEPLRRERDMGVMITLWDQGAWGYAATRNTSEAGIREAIAWAHAHLDRTSSKQLPWPKDFSWPHPQGCYESQVQQPWQNVSLSDKVTLLMDINHSMKQDERIVYRESSLWSADETHGYITHEGGDVVQRSHS